MRTEVQELKGTIDSQSKDLKEKSATTKKQASDISSTQASIVGLRDSVSYFVIISGWCLINHIFVFQNTAAPTQICMYMQVYDTRLQLEEAERKEQKMATDYEILMVENSHLTEEIDKFGEIVQRRAGRIVLG